MNHTVHFVSPDQPALAAAKALAVIDELGAPLKSDSGHFVTGAIPNPGGSIEVLISWLPAGDGTQVTVQTTGADEFANAVYRSAERVRDTFLRTGKLSRPTTRGFNVTAFIVVLSLFVVIGAFFFIMLKH